MTAAIKLSIFALLPTMDNGVIPATRTNQASPRNAAGGWELRCRKCRKKVQTVPSVKIRQYRKLLICLMRERRTGTTGARIVSPMFSDSERKGER